MKNILKKVALVSAFVMTLGVGATIGVNLDDTKDYFITANAVESTTASTVWDGSYDIDWYDTSKTEFEISTAEQLAGLAQIVNNGNDMKGKTITLTNNIVLNDISDYDKWSGPNDLGEIYSPANNWTSIGNGTNTYVDAWHNGNNFNGTFDGNGFSIIGLYYYCTVDENVGLFGSCKNNAKIKNVKLEKLFIYDEDTTNNISTSVGGVVGYNYGGIVQNCYVNGNITSYNATYLGGVVGNNDIVNYSLPSPIIDSCCFEGYLTGDCEMGGICGDNRGIIRYCYNNGDVLGYYRTSGISSYNSGEIYECRNDGDISSDHGYVGGIVSGGGGTIDSCYNTGNISLLNTTYDEAGGIAGTCSSGSLSNSYSIGVVSSNSNSSHIGGVVGRGSKNYITNCYYKLDPIYKGDGSSTEEYIIGKSASAMQTEEFATLLGDKFVYVENSYPRLAWELDNDNLWSIDGNNTTDITIEPITPTDEYSRFDVNRDGSINILDLIELKQYILGLITE